MIILTKISLFQFRNYENKAFNLDFPVTCITGRNGSGKTNLLDAIYTLCYTKSYFSSVVQPTIMQGTDGYRVEGHFSLTNRAETVVCKYKNGKKEMSCGGSVYERQSDHIGKYAAVMVAPDDIEMINDGSELRRKFIDGIISQCDKLYLESLLQYQKVIIQRNAWLKMYQNNPNTDSTSLGFYDEILSQTGTYIFLARTEFLKEFFPLLKKFYQKFSAGSEDVHIDYQSDLNIHTMSIWLKDHLQYDIRYQRTLRGIHKDDFIFLSNGNPIKQYGSQGQKKSFLFSLKLAQYEYLKTKMGNSPILLLDDVFEKLDQQRMEALLSIISTPIFGQVIITDTHEDRVRIAFGSKEEIGFIKL